MVKKGFKYFISYNDEEKVNPFCTLFPKVRGYVKRFDETKCMSFLTRDNKLLEKFKILNLNSGINSAMLLKQELIVTECKLNNKKLK